MSRYNLLLRAVEEVTRRLLITSKRSDQSHPLSAWSPGMEFLESRVMLSGSPWTDTKEAVTGGSAAAITLSAATFQSGDRVEATERLTIRSAPAGSQVTVQNAGEKGRVTAGPVSAVYGGTSYNWYEVSWDDLSHGWSVGNYMRRAATAVRPSISRVSPGSPTGSDVAQPFTIFGSNFDSAATVTLRDKRTGDTFPNRPISARSSSTQITVNPRFTANAAQWSVEVINPGDQTSGEFLFQVTAPAAVRPSISRVSPTSPQATSERQNFTIYGSDFDGSATVKLYDPTGMPYALDASRVLGHNNTYITVNPNFGGSAGTWQAEVLNGSGEASNRYSFKVAAVTAVKPVIDRVVPDPISGSYSSQTITIIGSGFKSGASIRLREPLFQVDSTKSATFVSSTELRLSAVFGTDQTTWTAQVINPDGAASENIKSFTVNAPSSTVPAVNGDIPLRLPWRDGEEYKVTQGYGGSGGSDHTGYQVDFGMPQGTPVVATYSGIVTEVGSYSGNSRTGVGLTPIQQAGTYVKIRHQGTTSQWYSSYLHFSRRVMNVGDTVATGEVIGYSGNTGWSTGPHLHFHIRNGPTSSSTGFRPVPMAGIVVKSGSTTIQDFALGQSYRATGSVVSVSPSISRISPNPVTGSNTDQALMISGANFAPGAMVRLQEPTFKVDKTKPALFVSSTELSVDVNFGTDPTSWTVQVINPGGASSEPKSFPVTAPPANATDKAKQQAILNLVNSYRSALPPEFVIAEILQEAGQGAFHVDGSKYNPFYRASDGPYAQPTNGDGILQVTTGSGYRKSGPYTNDPNGYEHAIADGTAYLSDLNTEFGTLWQAALHYNTGPHSLYIYLGKNQGDQHYLAGIGANIRSLVPGLYALNNPTLAGQFDQAQQVIEKYLNNPIIAGGQSVDYYRSFQRQLDADLHDLTVPPSMSQQPYDLTPGFNLISFPFSPTATDGSHTLADVLAPAGGNLYGNAFVLVDNQFEEIPLASVQVEAKKGYFVYAYDDPRPIAVSGDAVSNPTIVLSPGWNLAGPTGPFVPSTNPSVYATAYSYNSTRSDFDESGLYSTGLQPGVGYYLFSFASGATTLVPRSSSAPAPAPVSAAFALSHVQDTGLAAVPATVGDDFTGTVQVTQTGAGPAPMLQFGVKPGATDAFDQGIDAIHFPAFPGSVDAFFEPSQNASFKERGSVEEWELVVRSARAMPGGTPTLAPVQIALTLPSQGSVNSDAVFQLLDGDGKVVIADLRPSAMTSFNVAVPATEMRYTIRASVSAPVPQNAPPVNSVPGQQAVDQDQPLVFSKANGNVISVSDPDAGTNTVQVSLTAMKGRISLAGTGGLSFSVGNGTNDRIATFTGTIADVNRVLDGLRFDPDVGFAGAASLRVVANDQGNSGSGGAMSDDDTISIAVRKVVQPHVTVTPTSGLRTTEAGGADTFTVVLDSAPTANVVIGLSSSDASEGTVAPASLTFTPENFATPQTVTVTGVDDALVDGNVSYTIITAPAVSGDANYGGRDAADVAVTNADDDVANLPPTAVDDAYSTNEDEALVVTPIGVLTNDTDPEKAKLTAALVAGAKNGVVTLNPNGAFTYVPNADFNGSDSFTYRANDGQADSGVATVRLTVAAVNDAPTAADDAYSTVQGTPLNVFKAKGVLVNDSDVDGDMLAAAVVDPPKNGVLTLKPDGSFVYTPEGAFTGTDTFTYRASDGKLPSRPASVTITVSPPAQRPPVALNDSYSIDEDTLLVVPAAGVLANDTDVNGDRLTAAVAVRPANGTLALAADGSFTYTPAANFNGSDRFTYRANDGTADSDLAAVVIDVKAVNDAPAPGDDSYVTPQDKPLTVKVPGVLANDTDADGDKLAVEPGSGPSHGTLALGRDGSFTYTPDAGFSGTDGFTYRATDGSASAPATVAITITPDTTPPPVVTPTLSIGDARVVEGDSGARDAVFTVTLSAASDLPVTVRYRTADGTAAAPSDYAAAGPATLTFEPGQTSRTVSVSVLGDAAVEADERFLVRLSDPTNATIADGEGVGTIVNDDTLPPTGQAAASFTLVNAETERDIMQLREGDTIDIAAVGTANFSIRANTDPTKVGSVRFGLDGNANVQTENLLPYASFGDNNNGADYNGRTFAVGQHTVTATPFTEARGGGAAGAPLSVTFNVVNTRVTPPTPVGPEVASFTLVNADTNRDIRELREGDTVDIAAVGTSHFSIRANTRPGRVGSVRFGLDGEANVQTENLLPYASFGDNNAGADYNGRTFAVGRHAVTATPFTDARGGGVAGTPLTVRFNVVNTRVVPPTPVGPRVTSFALVDADTDRDIMELTDGSVVSLSVVGTARLNVRANLAPPSVGSVRFGLDGNERFHTENVNFYTLFANDADNYFAGSFALGEHTITATGYESANARGRAGDAKTIRFTVVE